MATMSTSDHPVPPASAPGGSLSPLASTPAIGVALSGLLLVGFLVVHLAGLLPAVGDPAGFERYAALLHRQPWLPAVEVALLAAGLLHPGLALARALRLRRARGPAPALRRSRRQGPLESLASRAAALAPWTGSLLLLFLVVHLLQLRWQRPAAGEELQTLLTVLESPASLALYVTGSLAVGLHLFHGHEAAHRSLGLLDPGNGARIRQVGRLLALGLGGGFALLALILGGLGA
jgi:succinate dehydrogenase / fumarate reductase cytochrome b subunit